MPSLPFTQSENVRKRILQRLAELSVKAACSTMKYHQSRIHDTAAVVIADVVAVICVASSGNGRGNGSGSLCRRRRSSTCFEIQSSLLHWSLGCGTTGRQIWYCLWVSLDSTDCLHIQLRPERLT